jgi:hypothetical protein
VKEKEADGQDMADAAKLEEKKDEPDGNEPRGSGAALVKGPLRGARGSSCS